MAAKMTISMGDNPRGRHGVTHTKTGYAVSTVTRVALTADTRLGGYIHNKGPDVAWFGYDNGVTAAAADTDTVNMISVGGQISFHDGVFVHTGEVWVISEGTSNIIVEEYTG
jgi:hypothetical protein